MSHLKMLGIYSPVVSGIYIILTRCNSKGQTCNRNNLSPIEYKRGFIDVHQLEELAKPLIKTEYGQYLMDVVKGL